VGAGSCSGVSLDSNNLVPEASFISCLKIFLASTSGKSQSSNVRMNASGDTLTASKIRVEITKIEGAFDGVDMMNDVRNVVQVGPINTIIFQQDFYLYE
jgi:hypothetical protein